MIAANVCQAAESMQGRLIIENVSQTTKGYDEQVSDEGMMI